MDGTLKCCINVKFLKWKIAVFLRKGMPLFFKTRAMKIETKIYEMNNLFLNSSGMLNLTTYLRTRACVCVCVCMYVQREREVSKRIFYHFFNFSLSMKLFPSKKVSFFNNQKPLIHSLRSETFFPPYLKALHHQILMAHTETVV